MKCPHCQRGTPMQNGIHMGEVRMDRCELEPAALTLEPMTGTPKEFIWEVWHQPARRTDLPFTCGGKA
jgi:hypothetical protein